MSTQRIMEKPSCGADYAKHEAEFGSLPQTPADDLLKVVADSGLRGRGGAWFPTARKMQSVIGHADRHRHRPVVVGNAMEGEPAASGDAWISANHPNLILDGLELAARIVNADHAYLAFHADAPEVEVAKAALEARPKSNVKLEIVAAPPRYVASEETALIHFINAEVALPTYGERPFVHGVHGRPTLVNNAETLAQLALIARHGADWFREVGTADAPGTKLVSVGGSVGAPAVIEIAVGTPIRELVDEAGGINGTLTGFRTGGFGGTWVGPEFLDMDWDPDAMRAAGLAAGSGIVRPMSDQHCAIIESALVLDYLAGESAGQCGVCVFGLSSTANAMTELADKKANVASVEQLRTQLAAIPRRGACAMPDGGVRMTQSVLNVFEDEVNAHLRGTCTASHPLPGGQWTPIPERRPHPVAAPGRNLK